MPGPQPFVGFKQFAEQLTACTWDKQPGIFVPGSDCAWVAVQDGLPIAFGSGAILQEDGEMSSMKVGCGAIRFLLSGHAGGKACRAVIDALLARFRQFGCRDVRALSGYHGPPFHNFGGARLTSAWPWIGQALSRQGFQTRGLPSLCLNRSLDEPLEPIPLPADAELRRDWVTRIGVRDTDEYGYHVFVAPNSKPSG